MTLLVFCILLGVLVVSHARSKVPFASVMKSLELFKQQHTHLQVPYSFVVPIDGISHFDAADGLACVHVWPEECRGVALGAIVSRIRTRGDFTRDAAHRALLAGVGLLLLQDDGVYTEENGTDDSGTTSVSTASTAMAIGQTGHVPSSLDLRYALFVAALRHYKALFGHVHVPANFVVPLAVPTTVLTVTSPPTSPLYAVPRMAIAAAADANADANVDNVCVCTSTSTSTSKNTSTGTCTGADTNAGAGDGAWPRNCGGLRLGQVLDGVRRKGNYVRHCGTRQQEMTSLGVSLPCQEDSVRQGQDEGGGDSEEDEEDETGPGAHKQQQRWRRKHSDEELLQALDIFRQRYGHMAVPGGYVVGTRHTPYSRRHEDPSPHYPHVLKGLRLGNKVAHIRNRGSFPHLHSSLTDVGFIWDPREGYENSEFRFIMDALATYELTGQVASFD